MKLITNNPLISVIILLLLTANIVTLGYLWTHQKNIDRSDIPQPPQQRGQVFEFITKELQLDSMQQQTYKLLREEHQSGQRLIMDNLRTAKDNFFELLKQPAAADSLIKLLSGKIAEGEEQLVFFNFKHFQKLRAICNKEQQSKFDSIIQEVLGRMTPGKRPMEPPPHRKQNENRPPPPPDE